MHICICFKNYDGWFTISIHDNFFASLKYEIIYSQILRHPACFDHVEKYFS